MEFYWRILLIAAACSCLIGQSLAQNTEGNLTRDLKRGARTIKRIMPAKFLRTDFNRDTEKVWNNMLSNITMLIEQHQVIENMLNKAHQQSTTFGSGDSAAAKNPDIERLTAAKVVMEETVQHLCPWLQSVAKHQFDDGTQFNCTMEEIKILGLRLRLRATADKIDSTLYDLYGPTDNLDYCDWIKDNLLCKLSAEALPYVVDPASCKENFNSTFIQNLCS